MYSFLTRNGQTVAFGIGILIAIAMIFTIGGGVGEWSQIPEDDMSRYDTSIFNLGMYGAFALIGLCAAAAVLFGVFHIASDFKGALKGVIGLAVVIVLFMVLKNTADPNADMLERLSEFAVTPNQSQGISGLIWTGLILAGGAVLATAVSEIINFFR